MITTDALRKILPGISSEAAQILVDKGKMMELPPQQMLLKEGYFVNALPVVLDGLLKVTRKEEDREILLYYIRKGESCIMSYSACITNTASKVFAITETASKVLLIAADTLQELTHDHPSFNRYLTSLYQNRYEELIGAIDLLVFRKFDERLLQYLQLKAEKLDQRVLNMTHQEIAGDTGTVREVVSRALKKLEKEGRISLTRNEIKIL